MAAARSATGPPKAMAAIARQASRSSGVSGRRTSIRRRSSRRLGQHHPDRERCRLVVDETELEQPLGEVARRGVRADLPGEGGAPALAQELVQLRADRLDLVHPQAEALRDVPARLVTRPIQRT